MEDTRIIELYHLRDEAAITATSSKYGGFCHRIAMNILNIREDAEECVQDTWLSAWEHMPPDRPRGLKAYLGRITRNLSFSRYRRRMADKRCEPMSVSLDELGECVPSQESVERTVDAAELAQYISDWLDSLHPRDCALFVRRYWYGDSIESLARLLGVTPAALATRLFRLRTRLRRYLEQHNIA